MPEKKVLSGANVGFLTGTQASVNTMLAAGSNAGAKHGCFYLAQDTHRLYVGNEDTSISPVNEGVQTVSTINDLPQTANPGEFYYISTPNILCVYSGSGASSTGWVQINTDTTVSSFNVSVTSSSNTVTVTDELRQSNNQIISGIHDFQLTGANGISVTAANDANNHGIVTITGTTYAIDAENATGVDPNKVIVSVDGGGNTSSVSIAGGTNTTVAQSTSGTEKIITIDSSDTLIQSGSIGQNPSGNGVAYSITDSGNVKRVDGVWDPIIEYGDNTTQSAHYLNNKFTLSVYTKDEIDQMKKALNAMTYCGTIGSTSSMPTGSAESYLGAGYDSSNTTLVEYPTSPSGDSTVSLGDTFLAVSNIYLTGESYPYKAGTLFVATGTENPNTGKITQATLHYDVIEGSAIDTQYKFADLDQENGIKILRMTDRQSEEAGRLAFEAKYNDDKIIIEKVVDSTTPSNIKSTIKIGHTKPASFSEPSYTYSDSGHSDLDTRSITTDFTITVIDAIVHDDYGHITGYTTKEYQLNTAYLTISGYKTSAATASANGVTTATITSTITEQNRNNSTTTHSNTFNIASETLNVTATNNNDNTVGTVTMNLVWGTF